MISVLFDFISYPNFSKLQPFCFYFTDDSTSFTLRSTNKKNFFRLHFFLEKKNSTNLKTANIQYFPNFKTHFFCLQKLFSYNFSFDFRSLKTVWSSSLNFEGSYILQRFVNFGVEKTVSLKTGHLSDSHQL